MEQLLSVGKAYLKINSLVKTPLHEFMAVERSGLWAPGHAQMVIEYGKQNKLKFDFCFSSRSSVFLRGTLNETLRHKILALCPEHPKRDQNPKFTPLSETTSIPVCFIWESPPPGVSGKKTVLKTKTFCKQKQGICDSLPRSFKQGVRQQRVRSKTKERPDALPLAL